MTSFEAKPQEDSSLSRVPLEAAQGTLAAWMLKCFGLNLALGVAWFWCSCEMLLVLSSELTASLVSSTILVWAEMTAYPSAHQCTRIVWGCWGGKLCHCFPWGTIPPWKGWKGIYLCMAFPTSDNELLHRETRESKSSSYSAQHFVRAKSLCPPGSCGSHSGIFIC